jgi:hypothetical protein
MTVYLAMFASSVERSILGNAKFPNPSTNKEAFALRLDVAATRAAERKSCLGIPEWLDPIFGTEDVARDG